MGANNKARSFGQRGFTYLGVMIFVAFFALLCHASLTLGKVMHRRAAEEALLETGASFSEALTSYARATPRGQSDAPPKVQDLLRDPRLPGNVRHLRKVFMDPLTGSFEWGMELDCDDGGILAIYSLSTGRPIKLAGFDDRFADFAGKTTYGAWKFRRADEPATRASAPRDRFISPRDLLQQENAATERDASGRCKQKLGQ